MSEPTTSDMTVEQILDKMLNDTLDYVERMEKVNSPVLFLGKYKAEALAAIEAHYAAKERADMEYVIGEDEMSYSLPLGTTENMFMHQRIRDSLRAGQRQRMAERLNNTEERDE